MGNIKLFESKQIRDVWSQEALVEATKYCSLGRITKALFEDEGQH